MSAFDKQIPLYLVIGQGTSVANKG